MTYNCYIITLHIFMNPIKRSLLLCLLSVPLLLPLKLSADTTPKVLASIRPIHSLVTGIMQGVSEPTLLMQSNQSLHHYNLRPSERRAVADADIIFWVGPELESFLPRLLNGKESVALIDSNNITLLDNQGHGHDGHHDHQHDPHIWLSTANAMVLVDAITERLASFDPRHSKQYKANNRRLRNKISALHLKLKARLQHSQKPYVTSHNAIRYFEDEFQLKNIASVQNNPEIQPGARHLGHVTRTIRENDVTCLFYNEGETSRLLDSLEKQTSVELHALNPTGIGLADGETTWFTIMESIADTVYSCLKDPH